jgi:tricorn protease
MTTPRALLVAALLSFSAAASAQEPIRFARTPDISPDGKLIAFSYLGDIWTVDAVGGVARPVTMHQAHDINPVFSPDGKQIAFSSNRHGSYDIFVAPAVGGKPKRLTFDHASDMVTGWTPDGKHVVFTSNRGTAFPMVLPECFTVPADGGAEKRLPLFEGKEAHYSPDGQSIAFVRGPGLWYRRGYHGSSNDDIWLATADGKTQRPFTSFDGQDGSPMWSPDGSKLYYVTEDGSAAGCANIVVRDAKSLGNREAKRITTHADDTVRRARISKNGEWIVYECGVDLWVVNTKSGENRKIAIEVNADEKANTERNETFTSRADEFALSPDEDMAVFAIHGDLFLTKLPDGGKATPLTDSSAVDYNASFSPDGKSILFASDRGGVVDLYLLESDDPDHSELIKSHKFKVKRLTNTPEEESGAMFNPKGDRISFIRSGKLWTMKPDGTDQKPLYDQTAVFDYDWSPDGKWVVAARSDGFFASELYILPVDGSEKPRNVTRYATFNGDVTWSATGGKIGFVSFREKYYAPHVLSLQRPSATSSRFTGEIEWDDLHRRVTRAANLAADTAAISPNGSQIAFRSPFNGDDLWVADSGGTQQARLTSGNMKPKQIRWAKKVPGLIYFLTESGELRFVRIGFGIQVPPGGFPDPGRVRFEAKLTIRRDDEFAEMFTQCWRGLSDHFYDAKMHGADWSAIRRRYEPLVGHVAMKEDLYALIQLMLGELNASHLGISGQLPSPQEFTADLGLVFDESYTGPGLKIAEVLKRGPADKRGLKLGAGDIVLAIDRTELTPQVNLSQLLNNKINEGVFLDVTSDPKDPTAKRRVEIVAVSRDRTIELHYERWVERNAAEVAKLSGGKLGYIHISGMDEKGLESFVRSLYSDNFDKEAVVIDVRYNGGGFTHDQVLNYLTGKEHTIFRPRDGGEGLVMRNYDRKWTKPLAVLINNRSYSDAEIFPHAFRTLGLGKVVGQPTGGIVIGTMSTKLIDGSTFRLPRTGVFTVQGANMEKEGVKPDVWIDNTVDDWKKGTDSQLAKAVEVLASEVALWKKSKAPPIPVSVSPPPRPEVAPMPTPKEPPRIPRAAE